MTIKKGMTLYRRDPSYTSSNPKKFTPYVIDGESKFSWIVRSGHWDETKISKTALTEKASHGYGPTQWYTKEGMEDYLWVQQHRLRISSSVSFITDTAILKRIAAMIGYDVS